jgi:hypothetical protein
MCEDTHANELGTILILELILVCPSIVLLALNVSANW